MMTDLYIHASPDLLVHGDEETEKFDFTFVHNWLRKNGVPFKYNVIRGTIRIDAEVVITEAGLVVLVGGDDDD